MNTAKRTGVEYFEVDSTRVGQRLDNYLMARLKGVPRSIIYRILRTGQVRVNKGRAKPGYKVQAGDSIRIPPLTVAEPATVEQRDAELAGRALTDSVLYEDDDLLVINKPSGIAVHGGSGLRYGLIEALRAYEPRYAHIELVHRLDRGTSGCLLLAKNLPTLRRLHELLRDHSVQKTYAAVLQGRLAQKTIEIDTALASHRLQGDERMVQVSEDGKVAKTHIHLETNYVDACLVKVMIDTGRTHQIRVHCASLGHPVAGDDKYGDRDFNKALRKLGLQRLFLHAARLQFSLDKTFDIIAPLPLELTAFLQKLQNAESISVIDF